jgi:hypothetical protein
MWLSTLRGGGGGRRGGGGGGGGKGLVFSVRFRV